MVIHEVVSVARRVAETAVAPLRVRLRSVIRRAVLTSLDDSKGLGQAQVTLTADDPADGVELVTLHGFTSAPRAGAEALVFACNGNPQALVGVAFDRRYRLTDLGAGEAALHIGEEGQVIHLKADGSIVITPAAGVRVTIGQGPGHQPLAKNGDVKDILTDLASAATTIAAAWAAAPGITYATDAVPLKAAYASAATTLTAAVAKIAVLLGCLEVEGA